MSNDWLDVTLGDFVELKRGYDLPKHSRRRGAVPLISSSGLSDFHDEAKVKGPGVVTGRYGTIGQVFFVEQDFWPLNTTLYVRDFKNNDEAFVYYFLKTINYTEYSDKAAVPGVNRNHLHMAKISVPSDLGTQKAIASILNSFDKKIELNSQLYQTLESIAQAVFKSWFVDFDPVIDNALAAGNSIPEPFQARAERRKQRLYEGQSDLQPMPAELRKLFPDAFVETEQLGWVPTGWVLKRVDEFVNVTDFVANGSFASLKENVTLLDDPDYALYIRTTDFKNGFDKAKAKYVDKKSFEYLKKSVLEGDEVIISNVGDTGTVFMPPTWMCMPMTLGANAIALKAPNYSEFLHAYFQSEYGQHQISGIVGGSAQPKFNKTDFRSLKVLIPGNEVLEIFESKLKVSRDKIRLTQRNTDILKTLRDFLLPKLLSGQLRIPDVEALAEEAMA